jgi:hypothetical protein
MVQSGGGWLVIVGGLVEMTGPERRVKRSKLSMMFDA